MTLFRKKSENKRGDRCKCGNHTDNLGGNATTIPHGRTAVLFCNGYSEVCNGEVVPDAGLARFFHNLGIDVLYVSTRNQFDKSVVIFISPDDADRFFAGLSPVSQEVTQDSI